MAEPTQADREKAQEICDDLTFGNHSWDGAVEAMARHLVEAEEGGVHDFLQWLAAQNGGFGIALVTFTPGFVVDGIEEEHQPGQLLERWKAERNG